MGRTGHRLAIGGYVPLTGGDEANSTLSKPEQTPTPTQPTEPKLTGVEYRHTFLSGPSPWYAALLPGVDLEGRTVQLGHPGALDLCSTLCAACCGDPWVA